MKPRTDLGVKTGHVLITSAGAKAPMVRALKQATVAVDSAIRVLVGDVDEGAPARYVCDDFWPMPHTNAANIPSLIDGCRSRGIRTIFPSRDGELQVLADHAERFRNEGIEVIVSPAPSVARCLDKLSFAQFGRDQGLPFIPAELRPSGKTRYVVKERFGAGSRGVGINLDRAAAMTHAEGLSAPIYQPMIFGREISVDAWASRTHVVKGLVLRYRDRVSHGESQVTTTFRDKALEARFRKVLEALQLCGPVVLQAIVDEQGSAHIIECNARFGGASTASIAVGLDLFYWSLLERCHHDLSQTPFQRHTDEVRQVRLPHDLHIHASRF